MIDDHTFYMHKMNGRCLHGLELFEKGFKKVVSISRVILVLLSNGILASRISGYDLKEND